MSKSSEHYNSSKELSSLHVVPKEEIQLATLVKIHRESLSFRDGIRFEETNTILSNNGAPCF